MKTILEVDRQIEDYKNEYKQVVSENPKEFNKQKKANARIGKSVKFLRSVKAYLEFSPTEEFIQKQKKQLNLKISSVDKQLLSSKITCKKTIAKIKKEEGVTLAKEQLKVLNFIL